MKKFVRPVIIAISFILLVVNSHPAFAAEPANLACLGEDFSGYARSGETNPVSIVSFGPGVGFGGFISGLAVGTQGIGDEIQNHLSGGVSEAIISNSCND